MSRHLVLLGLVVALLAPIAPAALAAAAASCESLATLSLPDTTITLATSVAAGPFVPPDMDAPVTVPAFCRVAGVAMPTSDSVIKFEVWLPTTGWNGRFNGAGNGGYGRGFNVPVRFMVEGLRRGYATVGTDMGHPRTFGYDASWAFGHPEKLIDWASRANHVTAEAAKTIIRAFYGTAPRLSYFTGCSDGGHEGLMEAQRYPGDYDGIIAGASANYWTHQSAAHVWQARAMLDSALPASKLPLITRAAVAACDALDGILDGILNDPRRCDFDPATIQCDGPDAPTCLTAPQVEAVKKIYAGPRNPRTGEQIYPGLEPSGEFGWTFFSTGGIGPTFYKYLVFEDPTWDLSTLDFDHDIAFADAKMASIIDSTDPDLTAFKARGGKLIMYHGWVDPAINPRNSINYFESVVAAMHRGHKPDFNAVADGPLRETQEFFRLFMLPGMGHCAGGPGLNTFDSLTALEQWVEHGVAPDRLIAAHTELPFGPNVVTPGTGDFTRPLCPYPQVARWTGAGSTDDAANFVCELRGVDRADEASGFDDGLQGRNNARRKQAR